MSDDKNMQNGIQNKYSGKGRKDELGEAGKLNKQRQNLQEQERTSTENASLEKELTWSRRQAQWFLHGLVDSIEQDSNNQREHRKSIVTTHDNISQSLNDLLECTKDLEQLQKINNVSSLIPKTVQETIKLKSAYIENSLHSNNFQSNHGVKFYDSMALSPSEIKPLIREILTYQLHKAGYDVNISFKENSTGDVPLEDDINFIIPLFSLMGAFLRDTHAENFAFPSASITWEIEDESLNSFKVDFSQCGSKVVPEELQGAIDRLLATHSTSKVLTSLNHHLLEAIYLASQQALVVNVHKDVFGKVVYSFVKSNKAKKFDISEPTNYLNLI